MKTLGAFGSASAILVAAAAVACGGDDGGAMTGDTGPSGTGGAPAGGGGMTSGAASGGEGTGAGATSGSGGTPMVPDDIANLEPWVWTPISLNTLADVDPCPMGGCAYSAVEGQSAVLNDWTSGAFASKQGIGGLVYFGGGHNGYYGNEVYFFDLATQLWSRRTDPTDAESPEGLEVDPATGALYDGNPIAFHTFDLVTYDVGTNSFVLTLVSDAPAPPFTLDYFTARYAWLFDLDTNTWSRGSDEAAEAGYMNFTGYDTSTGLVWSMSPGGTFQSYDAATDTWTERTHDPGVTDSSVAAVDPVHHAFVVVDTLNAHVLRARDLEDPDAPMVTLSLAGDTEIMQSTQIGFEWSSELGAFVGWSSGSALYFLHPPASGDWRTAAWTWERMDVAGLPPTDPVNGPYGKFQVDDAHRIALVCTARDAAVYAVRF